MFDLFFWRSSFEVTLLYFALGNFFFYSVSIFKFKFIMLLSNLYFCLQFDVTLTKLLKRREIFVLLNKLCVFFVHIFQVTHLKLAFASGSQGEWKFGVKWNLFFRKFGVLCFLEMPVLIFGLLPYYLRLIE